MKTRVRWHQLVGLTGPGAGASLSHPPCEPCGVAWAGGGAAGQSPAQHCTLITSSQTWDLPCRLPRECTQESHHHSALNLSSFPGDNPNKDMNPFITGVFGALAGAASVFGNTPLDVVKTRMQVWCQGTVWDCSACSSLGAPTACFRHMMPVRFGLGDVWDCS